MTRAIPAKPSLEYDRKRAKELLRRHRDRDPEVAARIADHLPYLRGRRPDVIFAHPLRLSEAQLVVAREYGIASWPRLVAHVRFLNATFDEQVGLFLAATRHNPPARAREMLEREPRIASADAYAAAAAGDVAALRAKVGADPSRATARGGPLDWEPLFYACYSRLHQGDAATSAGIVSCVELLLGSGADPNARCTTQEYPEHELSAIFAATSGSDHPALARVLLAAGADPDDDESLYHATELPGAACLDLLLPHIRQPNCNALNRMLDFEDPGGVRKLLEIGADPNHRYGHTANLSLHHAVTMGRSPEVVRLLLEFGAEIDARGDLGLTAYQLAGRFGLPEIQRTLREAGCCVTSSEREAFLAACARGDRASVLAATERDPHLVSSLDRSERLVLETAARANHDAALALMLEVGFDPNAASDGWPAVCHAAWWGGRESVRQLVANGADLELRNPFGGTALTSALHGSVHCTSPLPGASRERGRAGRAPEVYADIVTDLIAGGAKVDLSEERMDQLADELSAEVFDALMAAGT